MAAQSIGRHFKWEVTGYGPVLGAGLRFCYRWAHLA